MTGDAGSVDRPILAVLPVMINAQDDSMLVGSSYLIQSKVESDRNLINSRLATIEVKE
jgi:hypothetical protein